MRGYEQVNFKDLDFNLFKRFYDNIVILAGDDNLSNAMKLNNLMFGQMWKLDVVTIGVKPLRYTKEFIDLKDYFSLNVFDEKYKEQMEFLGTTTGRDTNKMQKLELTRSTFRGIPYFVEADTVIFCRKIFAEEIKQYSFFDNEVLDKNYHLKDFHTVYISEMYRIFIKEAEHIDIDDLNSFS